MPSTNRAKPVYADSEHPNESTSPHKHTIPLTNGANPLKTGLTIIALIILALGVGACQQKGIKQFEQASQLACGQDYTKTVSRQCACTGRPRCRDTHAHNTTWVYSTKSGRTTHSGWMDPQKTSRKPFTGTGMRTMGARERLPQRIWSPPKPPQKPARGIPSPKPVLDRNITMKDYAEIPMQSSPHYATNSRPRIAQAQQRETKLHEESQANQQTSLFQHGRIAINHTDRAESGVIFHRRKKAN
ncbi:MAG: hypothetical protein OXF08_08445 [Bacteroidetes bacterium]|nr:hypothetical protein [Bacteroidota bacterium]